MSIIWWWLNKGVILLIESSPITTQKSTGSYSSFKSRLLRLLMPLILLLQASTSLLALRNTAFQDEALYLLAGREILLSWVGKVSYVEPYGLYFSGYACLACCVC